MVHISALAASATIAAGLAAAANAPQCGSGQNCPASAPCCSQYGQCGAGAYCLGGCDPQFSHSLKSCVVAPTCQSEDFKFNSLDGFQANTIYLGDATQANWVSEGRPVYYDNSVMLTMAPDTVGTLLASTHYVWYGKISAKMKSSAGPGVVSAFIMMSDVKDEIDFEFVGSELNAVQSNYYWQGVLDYHNSKNLTVSQTDQDIHEYEIDWTPDTLTWSIDGNALRTLKRSDTWNATTSHYDYPQTPARIMISLWPAGLAKNGQGTIDWAGGLINWDSSDMTNGYYHSQVYELSVECYDPPDGAMIQGSKSYKYTSLVGTNNTVAITNDSGVLASFYATGEDMNKDPSGTGTGAPKPSSTNSSDNSDDSNDDGGDVETVPGISGAGSRGSDTTGASVGGQAASNGQAGTSGSGDLGITNGQFIQGTDAGSSGGTNAAAGGHGDQALKGSIFAVLVAVIALCAM